MPENRTAGAGLEGFAALTEEYEMLPAGGHVLCALSGGADSMCLLHLLLRRGREKGFSVCAAHFNHRLRGEESERDEAFVREMCERWGVPLTVGEGDVRSFAQREGQSLEEAARTLRYAFLEQSAQKEKCCRIATAHNAEDNLETLLLHLVRGAGLHGLAGIPPRRGRIVRPLLACSRAEIEDYLAAWGIPHVEDASNADERYSRNRLRGQVLPVLRQLNPNLARRTAQSMAYLRADDAYLNAQAREACACADVTPEGMCIPAQAIAQLPAALAPRAARYLLERTGEGDTDCSSTHLRALVALARSADPSAEIFLPGGRRAYRRYEELVITTRPAPESFLPVPLKIDGETPLTGSPWRVRCRPVQAPPPEAERDGCVYLAVRAFSAAPVLRPRQTGDRIALPRRGTKTIKKLLIEARIPRWEREALPILADGTEVAATAGFGADRRYLAQPGEAAYELLFWKEV